MSTFADNFPERHRGQESGCLHRLPAFELQPFFERSDEAGKGEHPLMNGPRPPETNGTANCEPHTL